MTISAPLHPPIHVEESQFVSGCSQVLNQVASDQRPVIVQREGVDVAVVVPVEFLELIRDSLSRQAAERIASKIDWHAASEALTPDPAWLEGDEPKPF
jgi:prevent-host-death family protein